MFGQTLLTHPVGYTLREFNAIFQIYSQNVYSGLFRDFGFGEWQGRYFISFCEESGKMPLITIEKRRLGPDRALFVASMPGAKGKLTEVARSEKIDSFVRQIRHKLEILTLGKKMPEGNIRAIASH